MSTFITGRCGVVGAQPYDALYEARTLLIASAAAAPDEIYPQRRRLGIPPHRLAPPRDAER